MEARDLGMLLLLGALWGASFLFIEVAVPALGPVLLVDLRVLLAATALALCTVIVGRLPPLWARWKEFLILGGLNAAAPFTLIAASQLNLTASLAAILDSTTPLFAAMVAAAWIGEALTVRKAVGLFLGVLGVAVLVGLDPVPLSGIVLLSVGASLLAALCYALGGVYAKRAFLSVPPLGMGIGQQAGRRSCSPQPPPLFPESLLLSRSCSPCWGWLCSRRPSPTYSTSASSPAADPRRPSP